MGDTSKEEVDLNTKDGEEDLVLDGDPLSTSPRGGRSESNGDDEDWKDEE